MHFEPLHVLVATADRDWGAHIQRHLQRRDVEVDVTTSPMDVLLSMDGNLDTPTLGAPGVVILDDRMCALGSLLLLVERVAARSALVLCVGDDGPLHPSCGVPLGAVSVLRRPVSLSALRSAVLGIGRLRAPTPQPLESGPDLTQLDRRELDEDEPVTERTPVFPAMFAP
ncbi:MAG: hypothetical protein HOO96_12165 [Polyangiaceae bacterium]|nr:hypothetical protein [Polyangiaceae bacterium]